MKYAQGDVIIKKITKLPSGEKKTDNQCKDKILAFGESTGHKHQIVDGSCEMFRILNKIYINALTECKLKHEEHKPITIPPGVYEVDTVRETDWVTKTIKKVVD